MQLRHYITIIQRVWILIVALPLVVALISIAIEVQQPQRYVASARVMVTQEPFINGIVGSEFPDFNVLNSWQSSSFIIDDVPQIITSRTFAEDVSAELTARTRIDIAPGLVQASLQANRLHRAITIAASADSPELAQALVQGAVFALQQNGLRYWGRTVSESSGLSVAVLDPASGGQPVSNTRQTVINVGVRTVLALAVAIGIAFLIHYLDDRLHDRQQTEEVLGVQVIGTIPRE